VAEFPVESLIMLVHLVSPLKLLNVTTSPPLVLKPLPQGKAVVFIHERRDFLATWGVKSNETHMESQASQERATSSRTCHLELLDRPQSHLLVEDRARGNMCRREEALGRACSPRTR